MYSNQVKCYIGGDQTNLENQIHSFEELPLTLTVEKVAEILGICKANAYNLCHNENFPCVRVGNRLIIPRPAFLLWMANPKGG